MSMLNYIPAILLTSSGLSNHTRSQPIKDLTGEQTLSNDFNRQTFIQLLYV